MERAPAPGFMLLEQLLLYRVLSKVFSSSLAGTCFTCQGQPVTALLCVVFLGATGVCASAKA